MQLYQLNKSITQIFIKKNIIILILYEFLFDPIII